MMHEATENNSFSQLAEQFLDLEGRRTPVGWSTEDAIRRSSVERVLLRMVLAAEPHPDDAVPCRLDVTVRTRTGRFQAQVSRVGAGGLYLTAERPFEPGDLIKLTVAPQEPFDHGFHVTGVVAITRDEDDHGAWVSFSPLGASTSEQRRFRRLLRELLRSAGEN